MTENHNQHKEISEAEPSEKKPTLEIAKNPELDNLQKELQAFADLLDHNRPISSDDVERVDYAMKHVDVDVGGNTGLSIEYAKTLYGIRENAKIWQEIKKGDFSNIGQLDYITDEVAEILSGYQGSLDLKGLFTLSDKAAEYLGNYDGRLDLSGLTVLSDKASECLSRHTGGRLDLDGLPALSDYAAEQLSRHKGELSLYHVKVISEKAAQYLSNQRYGLYVNNDVLQQIAKYKK